MNTTDVHSAEPVIPSGQPEVKVRTFASDILSIKQTGGGLPQFQTIKAPQLPLLETRSGEVFPSIAARQRTVLIIFSVAVVALFLLGYLLYKVFFSIGSRQEAIPPSTTNGENSASGTSTNPAEPQLIHETAFKRSTDQKLFFTLADPTDVASSPTSYREKLRTAFGESDPTSKFVEIEIYAADGVSATARDVFSVADIFVFEEYLFDEYFGADSTIFAYREGEDFWPGYILTLAAAESSPLLKSEIAKLEASRKIPNFFLDPIEERGAFYDETVGNQPVRVADFLSGPRFVYGWVDGRLILSTSYAGFVEAASRL